MAVLKIIICLLALAILALLFGNFDLVPSLIVLPGGEKLRLSYISAEDIASLQSKTLAYTSPLPLRMPRISLPDSFSPIPWHILDLNASLHKARKMGGILSGWTFANRFVDNSRLSEGVHIPRYIFEQDINQLRIDNGCADPKRPCPQYVYNVFTGQYTVTHTKTDDMISS